MLPLLTKTISTLSLVAVFSFTLVSTLAQENTNYGSNNPDQALDETEIPPEILREIKIRERTNDGAIDNCEQIVDNLEGVRAFYEGNNSLYFVRYERSLNKLRNLNTTLQEEGGEQDFDSLIVDFETLVNDFRLTSEDFYESLITTQEATCSRPRQEFLNQKNETQNKLEATAQKIVEINNFIRDQLKPEIDKLQTN